MHRSYITHYNSKGSKAAYGSVKLPSQLDLLGLEGEESLGRGRTQFCQYIWYGTYLEPT